MLRRAATSALWRSAATDTRRAHAIREPSLAQVAKRLSSSTLSSDRRPSSSATDISGSSSSAWAAWIQRRALQQEMPKRPDSHCAMSRQPSSSHSSDRSQRRTEASSRRWIAHSATNCESSCSRTAPARRSSRWLTQPLPSCAALVELVTATLPSCYEPLLVSDPITIANIRSIVKELGEDFGTGDPLGTASALGRVRGLEGRSSSSSVSRLAPTTPTRSGHATRSDHANSLGPSQSRWWGSIGILTLRSAATSIARP